MHQEFQEFTSTGDLLIDDLIPNHEEFIQRSFDREPVLYRGAMSHRPDMLPTSAVLDEILQLDVLPPEYIRLTRAGKGISRNAYTDIAEDIPRLSVLNKANVLTLFRSGATLTINHMEHVWPQARAILRPLARAFLCQTESVVFATPAGLAGFAPHTDSYGVLVVQAEGTKDWRVWPTEVGYPRSEATFDDQELGDPVLHETLRRGDVLYLPHGTPHAAAATSEQSIHISLGLKPRPWSEIVSRVLSDRLSSCVPDGFPALTEQNFAGVAAELSQHLLQLRDSLNGIDPASALTALRTELLDEIDERPSGGLLESRELDLYTADQQFRVCSVDLEVLERTEDHCRVRIEDFTMNVPTVIVDTLAGGVPEGRTLTCQEIYPGASESRALSAVKQLARVGALSAVR